MRFMFAGEGRTALLRVARVQCSGVAIRSFKEQLNAGQAPRVIAGPEPHRDRDEAISVCIGCFKANKDRMRCDRCRERGLPVGSGVVESTCKQIAGNRFRRSGCRWSKARANALLAAECCIENNRRPDVLDWRACRVAVA